LSAIFILIGASLIAATGFLIAFIVAARKGQFDDNYTPGVRMLFDDNYPQKPDSNQEQVQYDNNSNSNRKV
jgi:cbb3-type cytochrome oxidase maturation protein